MADDEILNQESSIMAEIADQQAMISELTTPLDLLPVYEENVSPGFTPGIHYLGIQNFDYL